MQGKLKQLASKDYSALIELWHKAGLSHRPEGRDSATNIKRQMEIETTRFLGIYESDELIAAVIVSHNGRKGWINRLAVLPSHQRKQVATKLIKACEEWLMENDIEIFAALIEDDNPGSMALFARNKYKRHEDIIYFTRRLHDKV